jgi:hypothetical protein
MSTIHRRLLTTTTALVVTCAATARADAPAGRYTVAGAVVTDTKTKLVWQQKTAMPGKRADAIAYCAGLGTAWRIPTMKELMTLVDDSRTRPAIDPVFASKATDSCMTSSVVGRLTVLDPQAYWLVNFLDGSNVFGSADGGCLRCVK